MVEKFKFNSFGCLLRYFKCCLRVSSFSVLQRLSETCEEHIREVIVESAKDYRQDLELLKACSDEVCAVHSTYL